MCIWARQAPQPKGQSRRGFALNNHPIGLVNVLANEGGVHDVMVLCAAVVAGLRGVHPGLEAVFDGLYARRVTV